MFKSVKDIENLEGKNVLIRVDLNVPVEKGRVMDDFRIKKILPTLQYLIDKGAKVLMISHMSGNEDNSLEPVARELEKHGVDFAGQILENESKNKISELKSGQGLLFENLRFDEREKSNDSKFAEEISKIADIYINEAFASSHRKHASIVGIPQFLPSYAGLLFEEEVKNLSIALDPPRPFLFILGGAKFTTKIPLAQKFSKIADYLVLGGALSNEFFQESGVMVGKSLVSDTDFDLSDFDMERMVLPLDLKVTDENHLRVSSPQNIEKNERVVDIGPKTIDRIAELADEAKFILWNGPVGEYKEGFKETSLEIARIISESDAKTIVGGGDTLSAISDIKVEDKLDFVSTAGGAMLDFIANGTLPGLEALEESLNSKPEILDKSE